MNFKGDYFMATILIVEDDKNTQLLTETRLNPYFTVLTADNGQKALDILEKRHIDCIISDIMMPLVDGYKLLKTLRSDGNKTPILLLTAKQAFEDKREGFSLGTDDYMTKPINYDELLWRVNALLRRSNIAGSKKIVIDNLIVDSASFTVTLNGANIEMSKKEFELLYKLLSYPSQIFTRNQLLDEIWGFDSESCEDTIKTHISRLRARFMGCDIFEIVTVKGIGYKAEIKNKSNK